ncbi:glycosyltransferase family 4 protein [Patescibacteria group bacterium]|nr:glycosyltransferase family 4 protein [Patescibacteria group bacterium]MCL5091214.1 glycosyltransferase family 4 protein [Patescibacteria group bacterium]
MIIGVDGNEANVKQRVGVSVYTLKLLEYFRKKADANIKWRVFLRRPPLSHLPRPNRYFSYQVVSGSRLWLPVFLPLHLNLHRDIDRFFAPAHYSPALLPVPLITTIHDLAFFYYPNEFLGQDLYKLKHWTAASVRRSRRVIAVSKTTKKDLLRFYHLPEDRIRVVYNGFEKNPVPRRTSQDAIPRPPNRYPYLLYVGTLQPRKNIETLIQAFAAIKHLYPHLQLYIVGKKGWQYEKVFSEIERLGIEDRVFVSGFVSDPQLAALYQNATCLVMPSFYEGFGLPVLEAMSFRCPVVSSFAASLPEVGADACLYFDPHSSSDLQEKLTMLMTDSQLRQELVRKGEQHIKQFSWNKCGEETFRVLTS